MSDGDQIWWTLGQVIGWVRATYPDPTVWDVRAGLEGRCASGRIQARGRRRIYSFDRFPKISHTDPSFVTFSEEYSYVNPLPEPIRPGEWRDLAFFARPIQRPGEDYLTGFERALNQSDVPIELRSKSKNRLAWMDLKFLREDVVREWPNDRFGAELEPVDQKTPGSPSDGIAAGSAEAGRSARRTTPVPDRQFRTWYQQRVCELTARGETSSGEQDWEAAKQGFPGRVTRARVRALREELAPEHWRQQGRRSARRES